MNDESFWRRSPVILRSISDEKSLFLKFVITLYRDSSTSLGMTVEEVITLRWDSSAPAYIIGTSERHLSGACTGASVTAWFSVFSILYGNHRKIDSAIMRKFSKISTSSSGT